MRLAFQNCPRSWHAFDETWTFCERNSKSIAAQKFLKFPRSEVEKGKRILSVGWQQVKQKNLEATRLKIKKKKSPVVSKLNQKNLIFHSAKARLRRTDSSFFSIFFFFLCFYGELQILKIASFPPIFSVRNNSSRLF